MATKNLYNNYKFIYSIFGAMIDKIESKVISQLQHFNRQIHFYKRDFHKIIF